MVVQLLGNLLINSDLDAVKVTVTVPVLQVVEDDGDITGSKVNFDIQLIIQWWTFYYSSI